MTREEAESLGWTDEALERACREHLGAAPELSGQPDDESAQEARELWFGQMMLHAQGGGYELQVSEPIGSFAMVRNDKPAGG